MYVFPRSMESIIVLSFKTSNMHRLAYPVGKKEATRFHPEAHWGILSIYYEVFLSLRFKQYWHIFLSTPATFTGVKTTFFL